MTSLTSLLVDLARILNQHSRENESDTPDFILAEYLLGCLRAFEAATKSRDARRSPTESAFTVYEPTDKGEWVERQTNSLAHEVGSRPRSHSTRTAPIGGHQCQPKSKPKPQTIRRKISCSSPPKRAK